MGQVKLPDHDLDVDSEVGFLAKNFDNAAARILCGGRPLRNFHVDNHAFEILPVGVYFGFVANDPVGGLFLCVGLLIGRLRDFHSRWDDDFLIHFFVDRLHVVVATPVVKDAHHRGVSASNGADDAALGPSVGADVGDFDEDAVAMHRGTSSVRRDENVPG